MKYHFVTDEIINLLKTRKIWFESFEHEPVTTSEQAVKVRPDYSLHQGAKAIIIRIKKTEQEKFFVMLVYPADSRFNKIKVKQYFNAKDIRFATEEEVEKVTGGVKIGGVPPFGNLFGLEVIVDPELFANGKIIFNASDRRLSLAMKSSDYKSIVKPKVLNIV